MKNFQDFCNEAQYRWTVYKVSQDGKSATKDGFKASFLEYLNHSELDSWMMQNASKYPMIVVVRSDGNWIQYDQPDGKKYKKGLSGKNFNREWKGKYNKKADVDS